MKGWAFWVSLFSMVLAISILLSSCANTKKVTQSRVIKTDSSSSLSTSHRTDSVQSARNIAAKDIYFDVIYDTGSIRPQRFLDSAHKITRGAKPPTEQTVFDFLPDHSRIVEIRGHIGSLSDSSSLSRQQASTKIVVAQQVAHTDAQVHTVASSWRWPLWLTIACIVAGLFVLLLIIKKIFP